MSLPLVSVIIPTYNAKDFIIESIESVVNQTYPNLEIIVSDDCSTDGTQDVIKNYLKDKPSSNIKVFFNKKNMGVSKNANQCYRACTGEYISLHAGDDIMLSDKLRTQVELMQKDPTCVISYHNIEVFDSKTNKALYYYNGLFKSIPRSGDVRKLIKYGCFCGGPSLMIRISQVPRQGYNETWAIGTDWLMWVESLINGGRIVYINKVLSRYRRHGDNITNKNSDFYEKAHLDTLSVINYLIIEHPQYLNELRHAFACALRGARHIKGGAFYNHFLKNSLKISFNMKAAVALFFSFITFGKTRL